MLGGVDHAGAYLRSAGDVPLLVLGAGPMLFMDPKSTPERASQDRWKAEAMVASLRELGLRAWAPGLNDYALGAKELEALTTGGPALLGANLRGASGGAQRSAVYTAGSVRVGVAGISRPQRGATLPDALRIGDPLTELRAAAKELDSQGAALKVALLALPRGEGLRLVEAVPDFHVALLGKPFDQGESNDPVTPPTTIGKTLVIEAPNHLQALYVVDFVIDEGRFEFVDGAGESGERIATETRIRELEERIASAERGSAAKADIEARRADLARAKARLRELEIAAKPPEQSYYRTRVVEVREKLGSDDKVKARLDEYYKRVNEHNRVEFKDRKAPPVPEGGSGYAGVEQCVSCHQQEYAFWSTTRHARAYQTLAVQNKQFNLDCVGCHVTGYEEPGGSSVVHAFENVQCETCHGPGSRHIQNPADLSLIRGQPDRGLCGPKCHHVPHVKPDWSVSDAWAHILGPGHGRGR